MKKKICLIVLISLWAVPAFPVEVVDTGWVRRYNAPAGGNDHATSIATDNLGNVYVTGYSIGVGTQEDYCTVKYLPNGDTAWVRRYNGPTDGKERAFAITVDDSGYVYVTGRGQIGSNDDYLTIKYNPDGDTVWVKRYDGSGSDKDEARAMGLDGSGNVFVTGSSSGESSNFDYLTIKYYSNGDTAWARSYNGPGNSTDLAEALALDCAGNVYVTGSSYGSGTGYDYTTIKYYSNGDTAWVRRYNDPYGNVDSALALTVDDSGAVYVTGGSMGTGTSYDYATIKYYSNGDTAWVRRYNGPPGNKQDYANAIALGDSGTIYVAGYGFGSGGNHDYATIKYYPNGDTAWVRRYNGPADDHDYTSAIDTDASNNVYVTGYSNGSGISLDYATVKYYPNGDTAWVTRYNGTGDSADYARAIAIDVSANVYVTGGSWGGGTNYDYATIKYIQYDSIPFAPAVHYGAGDAPYSVFCCDLDGDLDLDLTVANSVVDGHNITVFKNQGDGSFEPKVGYGYAVGNRPYSLFCADLDGDSYADATITNLDSYTLSILKNDGNGSFPDTLRTDYYVGNMPNSVFCADLDSDSDLDLAVSYSHPIINVAVLKNDGDGNFHLDSTYSADATPDDIFCADLDGDSDLDLAAPGLHSDSVSILKNRGDGTFQPKVDYGVGAAPRSVFCADFDGDTDIDLAVANEWSHNVSILMNDGDGTFYLDSSYAVGDLPQNIFCADLDGDSDLDLAVTREMDYSSNTISVLRNNGDGTFQPKVDYNVGIGPNFVFCADLDGDGDLDMAVANVLSDNVSILKNLTQVAANQPPWSFSLITPAEDDSVSAPITFGWQTPYDPNFGDQIRYDLHVSAVPSFDPDSTIVYDSLPLSKHTDTLDLDTYYWKVRAYDNWGAERWSNETWSFYVEPFCGDANGDWKVDISDAVYLILYLFKSGDPPKCTEPFTSCGDVSGDGEVTVSDVVYLIKYLLKGGEPPIC